MRRYSALLCVKSHELYWHTCAEHGKYRCQKHRCQQIDPKALLQVTIVFLPDILCDHDTRCRCDRAQHHTVHGGKFASQTDTRNADLPQLPDHDLIDHTKRGLQQ